MSRQLPVAAVALWLILSHDARAYGSGQFNTNLTRCNTCHTGGDSPTVKFTPAERVAKVGARFQITAGMPATLLLEAKTPPGKGLGFAIAADVGLTIESTQPDTRVDRQILGHARPLFIADGKYRVPFRITAAASSCGRTLMLRTTVLAANRNGAPSGDGMGAGSAPVFVICAPAVKITPAREPLKP